MLAQGHATCVTEVDKYAKGATKPGGYAAQGYYKDASGATVAVTAQPAASTCEPADTAFLSTRPPWTCSVCKVTCTSQDTLLGHAAGVKHRRRVSLHSSFLSYCNIAHASTMLLHCHCNELLAHQVTLP